MKRVYAIQQPFVFIVYSRPLVRGDKGGLVPLLVDSNTDEDDHQNGEHGEHTQKPNNGTSKQHGICGRFESHIHHENLNST